MPDAPASPRKVASSLSQQVRNQKKPGAPKPKGAVRAKSGCYTCRIRRKKCDEQPNEEGACQTCVRLRLQCLGFGAKRPDWMRENNSVTELREKIKTFLASQGMIKGHSGAGARTTEADPPVLVLVDSLHTSPPPTPAVSSSSSDDQRPPHNGMNTSFERAPPHYAPMPEQQHYDQNWQPAIPELGPHDHAMNRGPMLPNVNDMLYHPPAPAPPQPQPPSNMIQSPTSIVSASSWPVDVSSSYYPSTSTASMSTALSISTASYAPNAIVPVAQPYYNHPRSSLAASYNIDPNSFSDDEAEHMASPNGPRLPMALQGYGLAVPTDQRNLISHYLHNVLPIQYLLADPSIKDFMSNIIHASESAWNAACLLSALHMHCLQYPTQADSALVTSTYRRIQESLLGGNGRAYNEGDAMAGLHIVSSFLFSGGRGSWAVWLGVASQYVQTMLNDPQYPGPDQVLQAASESTRFIIKTTMWFDVLASVTTQQVPRFLETYRQLFKPMAYIGDGPSWTTPAVSMMPVMGCENKIVLAIAEISNLAYWKESSLRRGCLSIPELVHRGTVIEETLLVPSSPSSLPVPLAAGMYGPHALHAHLQTDAVAQRRRLANDIFRASAKVYLHTVMSGDYPACPEIKNAVNEAITALRAVPEQQPTTHRSVVRSVVFGICISGCLTDDPRQRSFLLNMLEKQQQTESVGNISEVMRLMKQVWARRDMERERGHCTPVDWREVMRETHADLLLLV